MVRLLIVDDNVQKINKIVKELEAKCSTEIFEIKTANYCNDAKLILQRENIDILILDICLPERPGAELKRDAGIALLKQIKGSSRFTYPRFVLAVSEYEELTKEFSVEAGMIHNSLYYDETKNEWKVRLIECVNTAISILNNNINKRSYDYDIAVICALAEELELVRHSCENVEEARVPDDDYIYYKGTMEHGGRIINIILTQSSQMGMVPAATLTTKLIYNFSPRYIVMTGISAGIKEKTNMGDIIAAEYAWDYGAGKEAKSGEENIHKNTIQQISIDTTVSNYLRRLSLDCNRLAQIKREYMGNKPAEELRLLIGPVATGASVVANSEIVRRIQDEQIRDVIAIEMEVYGVYYAARWAIDPKPRFVALKSVCDYADVKKTDEYHAYASYTSAKAFEILAKEYFDYSFN